ncbi:Dabb family protein [Autumnicola lenta]|uniref:Dabb family protein n=1 Tax=Autumnicola lenta TaxID=3075593 RepID=UPI003D77689A
MRHIVIFKFIPIATDAQIKKVTDSLGKLKKSIPGIVSFEHGLKNSPENKNKGFLSATSRTSTIWRDVGRYGNCRRCVRSGLLS